MLKKPQINFFLIVLILMVTTCKNQKIITIEEYIKMVDELPIMEEVYLYEMDSVQKVSDTIAVRRLKYDNKKLVYENNLQLKQNIETVNYYDEKNGLVFSEVKEGDKTISDFRAKIENGLIVSANQNFYHQGERESVFMEYHYTFNKGKKTKLLIDLGDDYVSIETYDESQNPTLNVFKLENDTLERTDFVYEENIMTRKKYHNFTRNEETIYEYDNGYVIKETYLKNGVREFYTDYHKDEQGNYLIDSKKD